MGCNRQKWLDLTETRALRGADSIVFYCLGPIIIQFSSKCTEIRKFLFRSIQLPFTKKYEKGYDISMNWVNPTEKRFLRQPTIFLDRVVSVTHERLYALYVCMYVCSSDASQQAACKTGRYHEHEPGKSRNERLTVTFAAYQFSMAYI